MIDFHHLIQKNGFAIINNVFTCDEVDSMISIIEDADQFNSSFRRTKDLFAIRRFLKEVPKSKKIIFNANLSLIINKLFSDDYFVTKSIYFDKPENSNWFVAWHQDLTISVNTKEDIVGYGSWTVKSDYFAVQPPENILRDIFAIRIHLDDTKATNGALKVIPGTHDQVERIENIDLEKANIVTCEVDAGGIMIMRPLLMHASERSTTNNKRRVIHIEFSKTKLPEKLNWAELDELEQIHQCASHS